MKGRKNRVKRRENRVKGRENRVKGRFLEKRNMKSKEEKKEVRRGRKI